MHITHKSLYKPVLILLHNKLLVLETKILPSFFYHAYLFRRSTSVKGYLLSNQEALIQKQDPKFPRGLTNYYCDTCNGVFYQNININKTCIYNVHFGINVIRDNSF